MALSDSEKTLLSELIEKFGAYKKLTPKQDLLVTLGKRTNRTADDDKKLQALLAVEKKRLALLESDKALDNILKAEKKSERDKFDNGTYQLGGLFRALIKENNPAFVSAFAEALKSKKIKATYKDNSPLYADYYDIVTKYQHSTPQPQQATPQQPQAQSPQDNPFLNELKKQGINPSQGNRPA